MGEMGGGGWEERGRRVGRQMNKKGARALTTARGARTARRWRDRGRVGGARGTGWLALSSSGGRGAGRPFCGGAGGQGGSFRPGATRARHGAPWAKRPTEPPPPTHHSSVGAKHVYYLSAEFLMGRSLTNAVFNLGLEGAYAEAVRVSV